MQTSTAIMLAAIVLLFIGESVAIIAEVVGAKQISSSQGSFIAVFVPMFIVITLAGALLVAGYLTGILAFGNIWVVTVLSITFILIAEPIINFAIFRQLPNTGAAIGLALGFAGLIVTLVLR